MNLIPLIFTEDELQEIQALQLKGGNTSLPLVQSYCSDSPCTEIHNHCTHPSCVVDNDCPGHVDTFCTNTECLIIKPQSSCPGAQLSCLS